MNIDTDSDVSSQSGQQEVDDNMNDNSVEDPLESWVDWMKRTARDAEDKLRKLKIDDWVTMQQKQKWNWAARVAQHNEYRWTFHAIRWDPLLHTKRSGLRKQDRPQKRWHDNITEYLDMEGYKDKWFNLAINHKEWKRIGSKIQQIPDWTQPQS